jgi:hypothetical protein
MSENENKIRGFNNSISYYKKHMESVNGNTRNEYKNIIKKLENAKQLALLKEQNIKG